MQGSKFGLTPQNGKIHETLIIEALVRSNPDIKKWRYSLRNAEDEERPDRSTLYDIYEETLLDGMVTSVTERIYLRCTNSKIIFEKEGQSDKEHPISKMIQTPIFLDVIKWIIESRWFGHSLIEFEFEKDGIKDAFLIPRKNVIPEKGLVVERVGVEKGIEYRQSPYIDYLLDVGKKKDLGLLNKATPYTIFKRFGLSAWGEYVERFGIPIQEYQYDPMNPNSRAEVEKLAKEQGSGAKIIMPIGTTTTLHKGADGQGSTVFSEYKKANEDDILLIFLLQTMTTKDGSSRSQAEVHQGGEDELIDGYKMFIELVLNFQLKPLLARHGFDVEGGVFKYEDADELSKMDFVKLLRELSNFGDIPLDVIEKNFGIKLTPKQQEALKPKPQEEDKEDSTKDDAKKNSLGTKKKSRYDVACCQLHELETFALSDKEESALLKRIFEQGGKRKFDYQYFNLLADGLIEQANKGWNEGKNIDYNSPDHLTRTLFELNLYRFSATKDLSLLQEVNKLIPKSSTFSEFEKQAASILGTYNKAYLQTEFNLANSTAQNTSNYLRNLEVADEFPYWEYQTVGDDLVRPEHQALDGVLFKAGESGKLTPPNGYGCRCELVPRDSKNGKEVLSDEDALKLLGDKALKAMQKAGFATNRAEQGFIFSEDQMYIPKFSESTLNHNSFDLLDYSDIAKKADKATLVNRTEKQAKDWFKGFVGKNALDDKDKVRFIDYNARPTILTLETMLKNKNWDVLDALPATLKNPDEVFFERKEGGYVLKMLKYYNPKPLVVELFITTNDTTITSWSFAQDADKARVGLLIKK